MTDKNWTPQEEWRLAEYLIQQVCERAMGRSEQECLYNYPHDVYFIGSLRPKQNEPQRVFNQPSHLRELINKLAPVAFGAEFRVRPEAGKLNISIELQWACYYRVFPTFEQQIEHQRQSMLESNSSVNISENLNQAGANLATNKLMLEDEQEEELAEIESPEVAESTLDRRRARRPRDRLFIRFRKIPCRAQGVVTLCCHPDGRWSVDDSSLQAALDEEMKRAQQAAMSDNERIRTSRSPYEQIKVPEAALDSEEDYRAFLQTLQTDVVPEWKWEVRSELRESNAYGQSENILSLEFINVSPCKVNSPNIEAFLFDTKAIFSFDKGRVLPFELELAPRGFRYNRNLWGRGFNCAVEKTNDDPPTFETTHTPIYRQMRYVTRTEPIARFADLVEDPIPTLDTILEAMENYLEEWDKAWQGYIASYPQWQTQFGGEFNRDRHQFEDEIRRFQRGIELIRNDEDVRLAFKLTNETFRRSYPPKESWRLFQIVFLVSQIPGIVSLRHPDSPDIAEREMVDIIHFPTGGGKTEAYLAVITFHCFYDRLRGKSAGVTAWTRFPLRLLTLQQTQRVADVIGVAELVRREQSDPRLNSSGVDGFAVGYFVGKEATPNEITPPRSGDPPDSTWSQANDPSARQYWKRVFRCPSCHTTTVRVEFDPQKIRIIHRCTNSQCAFPNGEIPVYVVDNEIYRYLPCVIVSTIDKLAGIGNQRKLAQIFGQVDGRCIIHGYYKGKCCQKDCTDRSRLQVGTPPGLTGPTLFVQDELHLLKEGLGTFDAHYETFVQRLRQEFGQKEPLKIIASSATIEAFQRQVEHLYGRDQTRARVFPSPGPTLKESFYAETLNYPQRLFVGVLPHNKTIFNAILELIEYYHREVQYLQRLSPCAPNPYGGVLLPATDEWKTLLDFYSTSLTYFLAHRELNSIRTDIEGDINPNLVRDGLSPLEISELTGSTSTDEVAQILERLERSSLDEQAPHTVLATSMVSHGVDVNRFNAMIFYGMPRQNAEYIQASSRVGRAHVGIVFTCLHPARERDRSHYAYFAKFHEFLGQLVEPVAINRWSKFSINRTLPGLFMGVLLQLIANRSDESNPNRYYMLDFVKQKIAEGTLQADDFIPLLEQAYCVQPPPNEAAFQKEIRLRVQQFLDQIVSAGSGNAFVSDALIPKPMRSLRDVDEPIEIELDSLGSQWATQDHH
ncbi:hypothetical protein J7M22_07650 [Candidatus Poribacteria bacterium]|nr:hypothetical protein [Candidatus Poribacteria bacterium]